MISYKQILNDEEIKKYINIIDKNNNFYMSHGIKHITSLIGIIENFVKVFNFGDDDKNILCICAVLHDIGRAIDNKKHAKASSNYAREYLKDKLDSDTIDVICSIISNHSWKSTKKNILEEVFCFCDKVDFSRERLEDNYSNKYVFSSVLDHIKKTNFYVEDNKFIFKICSDNTITFNDLLKEKNNYDIGIQYNVSVISNVMKLDGYLIYFDDELLYFGDEIFDIDGK